MLAQGRTDMLSQENKLYNKITFAMLAHCPLATLHRKIMYNIIWIYLD